MRASVRERKLKRDRVAFEVPERNDTLYVYTDKAGKWRWQLLAGNGEIVAASSQGYASKANAERNARRVLG